MQTDCPLRFPIESKPTHFMNTATRPLLTLCVISALLPPDRQRRS